MDLASFKNVFMLILISMVGNDEFTPMVFLYISPPHTRWDSPTWTHSHPLAHPIAFLPVFSLTICFVAIAKSLISSILMNDNYI